MPVLSRPTTRNSTQPDMKASLNMDLDSDYEEEITAPDLINCMELDNPADFVSKVIPVGQGMRLSILHLNIRSLKNKMHYDNFIHLLTLLNHPFDVIVLTETWIDHEVEKDLVQIPTYNSEHYIRDGRGGGIAVYIHRNCRYKCKQAVSVEECESLWIELESNNSGGKILLGAIYRPPNSSINTFIDSLNDTLSELIRENSKVIIIGDMNIDISITSGATYNDTLNALGFKSCIRVATRTSETTNTIIDHIYTNISDTFVESGCISTDISDHNATYAVLQDIDLKFQSEQANERFSFNRYDNEVFCERLSQVNWDEVYESHNADDAYNIFCDKFRECSNEYIITKSSIRSEKIKKPWITNALLKSINKKSKLYSRKCREPFNQKAKDDYNNYRNILEMLLKRAQKMYFDQQFENNANDKKKVWQTIYEAMNKKRYNTNNIPKELIVTNDSGTSKTSDIQEMCNTFNDYFVNVGKKVANSIKLQGKEKNIIEYLGPRVQQSIFLEPVTEEELVLLFNRIKINKSYGADMIHPRLLKDGKQHVIKPLVHVFNLSISTGHVPTIMKLARVVPIFKGGDTGNTGNYRPISVLSTVSKLLERVMANRILSFLNSMNFFYLLQFGFRKNHSTKMAVAEFANYVYQQIEKKNMCVGIFIDLKKAFDTVNHEGLHRKLEHYGIRGVALDWCQNYLTGRKQYVQLGNYRSEQSVISCGVPQGSILGPLFFLIYVNDLQNCLSHGTARLFADDTNIIYCGQNINTLRQHATNDLNLLTEWFKVNKLALNVTKSNFMVIRSKGKLIPPDISLRIDGGSLKMVQHTKYLGVIIDEFMDWNTHVRKICKTIAPIAGILSRVRYLVSFSILRQLYYALIHPHILYCIETWGAAYHNSLKPLIVLQKKVIRIITFSHPLTHSEDLFKFIRILPLSKLFFLNVGIIVQKELHENPCVKFGFQYRCQTHSHNLRNNNSLSNSPHRTNSFCQSILNIGAKIYNVIPDHIKANYRSFKFKQKLTDWLFQENIDITRIVFPHRFF